jgi:DtxR family Mn-dependent transcriptional regulator
MISLTNRAEELLETMWIKIVEEKTKSLDASLLRDDDVLDQLKKSKYITVNKNMISLTAQGKKEAANCVRRHRLAEKLLVDVLNYDKKHVHQPSCEMEHILHKGLDDNICTLLGHPRTCPHGKQIPEGKCCQSAKDVPKNQIMPLSEVKEKMKVKVAYLNTFDKSALQKLIAMNILPGKKLMVIQKYPSFLFSIGHSQFAIDKELAKHIFVKLH